MGDESKSLPLLFVIYSRHVFGCCKENCPKNENSRKKFYCFSLQIVSGSTILLLESFSHLIVLCVVRSSRLRWFEHVERKSEADWVKKSLKFEVEGKHLRGRPSIMIWMEVMNNDASVLNAGTYGGCSE